MIKVKKERLEDLLSIGFEKYIYTIDDFRFGGVEYTKKLRVGSIEVDSDGELAYCTNQYISENHLEEMEYLSSRLIADRHDVYMTIEGLIEKEMLEDE